MIAEEPFNGTELNCVGSIQHKEIGATSLEGEILFLAHQDSAPSNIVNFYTSVSGMQ